MGISNQLDSAALDFARYCLNQPQSFVDENSHYLEVRPDGFNSGPESFADCYSLDYEDLRLVLPLVAYWCSLNGVLLEIICSSSLQFECRFTEGYGDGQNVVQIIETTGSADLCLELLSGAAYLAKQMKSVNALPRPMGA